MLPALSRVPVGSLPTLIHRLSSTRFLCKGGRDRQRHGDTVLRPCSVASRQPCAERQRVALLPPRPRACRSVPASPAGAPPPALLGDLSHRRLWPFKAQSMLQCSWNLSAIPRLALACRVSQTLPNPDTWPFLVTLKVKKKY